MKGLKKCYGLLLALFIMGGLSLSVCSADTNAYKYNFDYIPLVVYPDRYGSVPTSVGSLGLYLPLAFKSNESYNFSKSSNLWFFNAEYDDNTGECVYQNYRNANSSLIYPSFYIPVYLQPFDDYYLTSAARCNVDGPIPNFRRNSLPPYVFGNPNLASFLPYRYDYNGLFLNSQFTEEGYYYVSKFELSELFDDGKIPDSFTRLDIPLGYSTIPLSENDDIFISGAFYFDSDTPDTSVPSLGSNGNLSLISSLFNSPSDFKNGSALVQYSRSSSCSLWFAPNPIENEAPWRLNFQCSLDITSGTSNLSGFTLHFGSDSSENIWSYANTSRIYLDHIQIVTNNDAHSDPSGRTNFQDFTLYTNNPSNIPGGPISPPDVYQDGINFSSTLANLFNFNLINPFVGIFALFTDQSICADIPTLASMIHSEETTICPWFDSRTRSIVTPVLGLSSMMLLFGFVVHWLGARSGNLFEDEVNTDNYSFKNKFRRSK